MTQNRQTETVKWPVGTAAGTHEHNLVLDTQYEQCVGVAVYENSDGGIPNYKVGIKDDVETYQNNTHKNDWICGPEVAPNHRYKSLDIAVRGNKLTIRTQFDKELTADLSFDIVFLLSGRKTR